MHLLLFSSFLSLTLLACAPWHKRENAVFDETEPTDLSANAPSDISDLRAARWHLLRAIEGQALDQAQRSQQDLDQAFRILADLDERDATIDTAQAASLGIAIEKAYLDLLPHLERFSENSPLVLLLEGLSEEKIEDLPPDAAPLVRIHQLSRRCDIPIDANARVAASIHFFQTRGRQTFATWLRRSGRFNALIVDILRRENLPTDLFYLAMIESGFNPKAYSRARAVGLWQFMAHTGRMVGLDRTHWVDERRDPIKSTIGAARHLQDLFRQFSDWRLAMAAYNSGAGRVSRAITKAGTRDFWQLELPRETRNYVPLFMAAAIIAKDPQLFGFEAAEQEPAFAYDEVVLPSKWPYVDLVAAAKILDIKYAALRDLNPELRQAITPPGTRKPYRLRVPPGKGALFLDKYARLPSAQKAAIYQYEVQPGDNISGIAQAFGITTRTIAAANSLQNPNLIRPKQILYIPAAPGIDLATGKGGDQQQLTYIVRPGDSLSQIARKNGVRLRDLMRWNNLENTLIRPGQKLVLWKLQPRRSVPAISTGKGRKTYTVQPGDTLWDLARRFEVSVNELKTWNGLDKALIKPGQQLAIVDKSVYTVVKGDTLYSIARKFGLEPHVIARQNNISLSSTLLAGTTLQIPK